MGAVAISELEVINELEVIKMRIGRMTSVAHSR
jgi:hypothetical protein